MDHTKTVAILEHCVNAELLHLRALFQAEGYDVRIVGGAVRDILAGKTPKDIDLCTDAFPEEAIAIYEKFAIRYIPTGIDHGTISVVLNGETYEITSLRFDTETDGRHAKVTFTRDWKEDLARRDLTINAMSMTFDGELDDPFGGEQDLAKGVVQFVGDPELRIQEDYLRILRYFRFSARFGHGMFEQSQIDAIRKHAAGLKQVSRERVWQEVQKMLTDLLGDFVYEKMNAIGVLHYCDLPELDSDGVKLERLQTASMFCRNAASILGALCDSADDAVSYAKKLKISTDDTRLMRFVAQTVNNPSTDMLTAMKYAIVINGTPRDHAVQALCAMGDAITASHIQIFREPVFPVTGDDLIAAGMKPGKAMGQAIAQAKDLWFMSGFTLTKDDLIAQVVPKEA